MISEKNFSLASAMNHLSFFSGLRSISASIAVALLLGSVQTPLLASPAKINLDDFPGAVVDEVVVPVPSEVFGVLDKLGQPDWHRELRLSEVPRSSDRVKLALLFGTVVAEGFIAVQAQDAEAVEETGREVLRLAKAIGVEKAVVPHCQSIFEAARNQDWHSIRREFDRTQKTVRTTMEEMRDTDLAHCVSIGGWLRGTEVITTVIRSGYSEERADVLNQPDLANHFVDQLERMLEGDGKNETLHEIRSGVDKIQKVMQTKGDRSISPHGVSKIYRLSHRLVDMILEG